MSKELIIHGAFGVRYYAITLPGDELDSVVFSDLVTNYEGVSGNSFLQSLNEGKISLSLSEQTEVETYLDSKQGELQKKDYTIILKFENEEELSKYKNRVKREIVSVYKKCKKLHDHDQYVPLNASNFYEQQFVPCNSRNITAVSTLDPIDYYVLVELNDKTIDLEALQQMESKGTIVNKERFHSLVYNETIILGNQQREKVASILDKNPDYFVFSIQNTFSVAGEFKNFVIEKANYYLNLYNQLKKQNLEKNGFTSSMVSPQYKEQKGFSLGKKIKGGLAICSVALGIIGAGYHLMKSSNSIYQPEEMTTSIEQDFVYTPSETEQKVDETISSVLDLDDSIEKLASAWLSKVSGSHGLTSQVVADTFYLFNYDSLKSNENYNDYHIKYGSHDLMNSYNQFVQFIYDSSTKGVYYDLSSLCIHEHGQAMFQSMNQSIIDIQQSIQNDQMDHAMEEMQNFSMNYMKNYYSSLQNNNFSEQMILKIYLQFMAQYQAYPLDGNKIVASLNELDISIPSQDYDVLLEDVEMSIGSIYELPSTSKTR